MKKSIIIICLIIIALAICITFAACENKESSPAQKAEYTLDINSVYALAEEAGYTGSLEDLIALFKGANGETPTIGENKHWFIGRVDTGVVAEGKDGLTPSIGENKHWFIGEFDTGIIAEGSVNTINDNDSTPSTTTYTISFDLNDGQSLSPIAPISIESLSQGLDEYLFPFEITKKSQYFRGWSCNGKKVLDEFGNIINAIDLQPQMTFHALYASTPKVTITTNLPNAAEIIGEGDYAYNSDVELKANLHEGFKLIGWQYDGITISTKQNYRFKMWDKDVKLEAIFGYNQYKLELEPTIKTKKSNGFYEKYVCINPIGSYSFDFDQTFPATVSEDFEFQTSVTIAAVSEWKRFLGWFHNNELVSTDAVYTFEMPNYNYHLIAKWED